MKLRIRLKKYLQNPQLHSRCNQLLLGRITKNGELDENTGSNVLGNVDYDHQLNENARN